MMLEVARRVRVPEIMRGLEPTDWVKVGWEDQHKKYDYDYDKDEDEDEDEDEDYD